MFRVSSVCRVNTGMPLRLRRSWGHCLMSSTLMSWLMRVPCQRYAMTERQCLFTRLGAAVQASNSEATVGPSANINKSILLVREDPGNQQTQLAPVVKSFATPSPSCTVCPPHTMTQRTVLDQRRVWT
ncbi:hypothetical protein DAEQUDRAFT_463016 [Daedalea quercina L-15889]|uniref:Uncharacterized protein n=1 Tax=Daedalea quercina L-15889 TaxID=1314783 RepID=A0A165TE08_9APHY|nr:hypothetical protein DAEQUDRAFT_463016 [Daedalea quercina L-15889]